MYIKAAGLDREELLRQRVEEIVEAKSRYHSTMLGEPKEITLAKGKLQGVCMVLGLEHEIKNNEIIFVQFSTDKEIARFPFAPVETW